MQAWLAEETIKNGTVSKLLTGNVYCYYLIIIIIITTKCISSNSIMHNKRNNAQPSSNLEGCTDMKILADTDNR